LLLDELDQECISCAGCSRPEAQGDAAMSKVNVTCQLCGASRRSVAEGAAAEEWVRKHVDSKHGRSPTIWGRFKYEKA
jgi:hypothetical protein